MSIGVTKPKLLLHQHVRKSKGNSFHQLLGIANRDQVTLCLSCYDDVHIGRYDGGLLTKLAKLAQF